MTKKSGFVLEVLGFGEVHTLPGTWGSDRYRALLDLFDYDDIASIDEPDLPEMSAMAAQDKGLREAADRVLFLVFGESMGSGVRQNLIDDLTDDRPWEQFADIGRQAGIFETVEFLQKAFPSEFGIPDAVRATIRVTAAGKREKDWLREGPSAALLLRLLAAAMDERAALRRLYADQLEGASFPDAAGIIWSVAMVEDELEETSASCVLEVHSSLQWLGPLAGSSGEYTSDAEPDD